MTMNPKGTDTLEGKPTRQAASNSLGNNSTTGVMESLLIKNDVTS